LKKLFGTSGIRGLANQEVTAELAAKVGLALASYLNEGTVLIGRDTRTSGSMIEYALTAGLLAGGVSVKKLGIVPTPVLAYLTKRTKADAGVMITASHNPPRYNGIKIFNSDSTALSEHQQREIEEILRNGKFKLTTWKEIKSAIESEALVEYYVDEALENLTLKKAWRIVVDPGCGATFKLAPEIFRRLGCEVRAVNAQPDGFFPGRLPLPDENTLKSLCGVVKELKADLGVAYDGDGDRMVLIDENGSFCSLDRTLASYASYVVEKEGSGKIVTHVEASMCIDRMVERVDGVVIRTKVGDVNIADAIRKHDAIFGGEPCGAWIHPEFHFCPDGILSSVLFLKMLEERGVSLSEALSVVPSYPIFRENVECPNIIKNEAMKKIEEEIFEVFPNLCEKSTVDGVRVTLPNGWVLVRPSGTEPLIRITVEAENREDAEALMGKAKGLVVKAVKEATK